MDHSLQYKNVCQREECVDYKIVCTESKTFCTKYVIDKYHQAKCANQDSVCVKYDRVCQQRKCFEYKPVCAKTEKECLSYDRVCVKEACVKADVLCKATKNVCTALQNVCQQPRKAFSVEKKITRG